MASSIGEFVLKALLLMYNVVCLVIGSLAIFFAVQLSKNSNCASISRTDGLILIFIGSFYLLLSLMSIFGISLDYPILLKLYAFFTVILLVLVIVFLVRIPKLTTENQLPGKGKSAKEDIKKNFNQTLIGNNTVEFNSTMIINSIQDKKNGTDAGKSDIKNTVLKPINGSIPNLTNQSPCKLPFFQNTIIGISMFVLQTIFSFVTCCIAFPFSVSFGESGFELKSRKSRSDSSSSSNSSASSDSKSSSHSESDNHQEPVVVSVSYQLPQESSSDFKSSSSSSSSSESDSSHESIVIDGSCSPRGACSGSEYGSRPDISLHGSSSLHQSKHDSKSSSKSGSYHESTPASASASPCGSISGSKSSSSSSSDSESDHESANFDKSCSDGESSAAEEYDSCHESDSHHESSNFEKPCSDDEEFYASEE